MEGVTKLSSLLFSSIRILAFPNSSPAIIKSPLFNRPSVIKIVATAPFPLSIPDSITTPTALPSLDAFRSKISDCKTMVSNKFSIPSPVFAEILTNRQSPPKSSGTISFAIISFRTFSISDSGLSILFIATMIGTTDALACSIDSTVCGFTPSLAATTRMIISVTLAPRALILLKAACPGVSKNVMEFDLWSIE